MVDGHVCGEISGVVVVVEGNRFLYMALEYCEVWTVRGTKSWLKFVYLCPNLSRSMSTP